MNYIFLLFEDDGYHQILEGVFSSRKKAESYKKRLCMRRAKNYISAYDDEPEITIKILFESQSGVFNIEEHKINTVLNNDAS